MSTKYRPPAVPAYDLDAIRTALTGRRFLLGISPEGLAEKAGLSRSAVRLIEAGHSAPSLGTLYALARALGCTVGDLAPGPTDPPKRKSGKS
jgi:transcriptional regulator with XRE-family HTH domain